jgi:hypothetical protein
MKLTARLRHVVFVSDWPVPEDLPGWQREGRRFLNAVIASYNKWVRHGLVHGNFVVKEGRAINADIEFGLQTWADVDGGENWAETLREIRAHLVATCPDCDLPL